MKLQRSKIFTTLLCLVLNAGWARSEQLDTRWLRFTISPEDGHCELHDKQANVTWSSTERRFGWVTAKVAEKSGRFELAACEISTVKGGLLAIFRPFGNEPKRELRVRIQSLADKKTLELAYEPPEATEIQEIALAESLLTVNDTGSGYLLVPVRQGLLIPADSGLSFNHRFDTYSYEGCHMRMVGAVQHGAAALVTWEDPYVAAEVKSNTNAPGMTARQKIETTLVLRKSARSLRIQVLGKGDHVAVANAYRELARERGWLVTWKVKLQDHPERAKLFGAVNFKLWSTLDRRMNEDSSKELSSRVNWTFNEAAQVAEHLKRDLRLDRVLFSIGGWIHRGYDNQHPDILPTAPECGGDAGFADCAQRVMQLGYLFCPHDNYQDIYRDSPSWDERYIMKTSDGKLAKGGHWAGGVAYLTCSRKALDLARRPQNLEAVRNLSSANAYFIDTTYASGLQECFDPAHPLTRADDLRWKQMLSDFARQTFGVFGSECGREWAIPHSDFFEGLTGVSGGFYHDANLTTKLGGHVVPMFDLVYRDCIAMYGKYGYDPYQAAGYVLHHILLGRPLNHHNIPAGLYWKTAATDEDEALAIHPTTPEVQALPGAARTLQLTHLWDIERPASGDWTAFVHFVDESGQIRFQNDYDPKPSVSAWQPGIQRQGPFTVHVPEGLKGSYAMRTGLFRKSDGRRARLEGRDSGERSYVVGRLRVSAEGIAFEPSGQALASGGDAAIFTRAHHGWAEGMHSLDRFVKNCYEVTSPLNELTAQMRMTQHSFITPDRTVQKAVFGSGADSVSVVINPGTSHHQYASKSWGKIDLPPNGFFVESTAFVAFLANSFNGEAYDEPALFTLRSLDKKALARSNKIRVYHGFGPEELRVKAQVCRVTREDVLE